MSEYKNLRFEFDLSDGETEIEIIRGLKTEDGYEIVSIPLFIRGLARGDVVAHGGLADVTTYFMDVVRPGGHSTIRLWFPKGADTQPVRDHLHALGCDSEVGKLARLVGVDVPPDVAYRPIREFLEQGMGAGIFDFEEAALGFKPVQAL